MGLLRTRRGRTLLAFAVVMTIACVLLGLWQLSRYAQRVERNDAVRAALDAAPVPLDELVPVDGDPADVPAEAQWRPASVSGRFDADATLGLRLRPVEGQPGVHVLTPLVLDDGSAVLVDRGFLATTARSGAAVAVPDPPSGEVTVVGRVRLSESGQGAGLDADAEPPSIRFVDVPDLRSSTGLPLAPVWLERVEQAPPDDAALSPLPTPRLSSGPSLIYAVQWFLFGVIAVVGFVVLARREQRPAPPGDPHPQAPHLPPPGVATPEQP